TSASSVSYTVTFDQAVTGVDSTDFQWVTSNGSLRAQTPVVVTGSGAAYTVQVNGLHGSGDLRLDLIDDHSIKNGGGMGLGGATNGSFQGQVYTIDQAGPSVLSIDRAGTAAGVVGATTVSFTVTFSEPVTGVGLADFALDATVGVTGTLTR